MVGCSLTAVGLEKKHVTHVLSGGLCKDGKQQGFCLYLPAPCSVFSKSCSYQRDLRFALGPGHLCFYTHYTRVSPLEWKGTYARRCVHHAYPSLVFSLAGQKTMTMASSSCHMQACLMYRLPLSLTHTHKHSGPPNSHTALVLPNLLLSCLWHRPIALPSLPFIFPSSHASSLFVSLFLISHSHYRYHHFSTNNNDGTYRAPLCVRQYVPVSFFSSSHPLPFPNHQTRLFYLHLSCTEAWHLRPCQIPGLPRGPAPVVGTCMARPPAYLLSACVERWVDVSWPFSSLSMLFFLPTFFPSAALVPSSPPTLCPSLA